MLGQEMIDPVDSMKRLSLHFLRDHPLKLLDFLYFQV